jgi:hypothetical protein
MPVFYFLREKHSHFLFLLNQLLLTQTKPSNNKNEYIKLRYIAFIIKALIAL